MKVFVYGTLRKGYNNHYLLKTSRYLCDTTTKGYKKDMGGIPAVDIRQEGIVEGEVYEIDDETLKKLDLLEGHPTFYERKEVTLENGMVVWIYTMELKGEIK